MKFKKPEFYRLLVTADFRTNEIMDYIEGALRRGTIDEDLIRYLDRSEGFLYCADNYNNTAQKMGQMALSELAQISTDASGNAFLVLSKRAQSADQRQIQRMRQAIDDGRQIGITSKALGNLASLIDINLEQLRR